MARLWGLCRPARQRERFNGENEEDMRMWTRAVPAAVGALALAVALTGCNDSDSGKDGESSGSSSSDGKATYRLGEASPPQESTMQKSKDSKFTVTPTKVQTGTKADMD